ncbi:MAG: hypothetical protein GY869_30435, partial [Planctomycetes bacterium]|nr:hypothetical protein [Planctomycetota bacterium]
LCSYAQETINNPTSSRDIVMFDGEAIVPYEPAESLNEMGLDVFPVHCFTDDSIIVSVDNILYNLIDGEHSRLNTPTVMDKTYHTNIGVSDSLFLYSSQNSRIYRYDGESLDQLPETRINSINNMDETDDYIWVAANSGVHRYQDGAWILNEYEDGLFNAPAHFLIHFDNGETMVGGGYGIRIIDPQTDTEAPETIIDATSNFDEFGISSNVRFTITGKDRWNFTQKDRLLYSYNINKGEYSQFQPNNLIEIGRLPAGEYTLYTLSDDGVRVLVDGELLFENWAWHHTTEDSGTIKLGAGRHTITVEYFEINGGARLRFWMVPKE